MNDHWLVLAEGFNHGPKQLNQSVGQYRGTPFVKLLASSHLSLGETLNGEVKENDGWLDSTMDKGRLSCALVCKLHGWPKHAKFFYATNAALNL
jgi:hypothetical protein